MTKLIKILSLNTFMIVILWCVVYHQTNDTLFWIGVVAALAYSTIRFIEEVD